MKKRVPNGINWPLPFGWRVGEQYRPPVQLASQVIRYEQEEMGNAHLEVPDFLLMELDRLKIGPGDMCWLCLTREAACDFARWGDGPPYRVETGDQAIILCEDDDSGYLVLVDSFRLQSDVLDRFKRSRSYWRSVSTDNTDASLEESGSSVVFGLTRLYP